ncbi:MAG: DNRLRE domain-containing protein [Pseudomonadota bacterium]
MTWNKEYRPFIASTGLLAAGAGILLAWGLNTASASEKGSATTTVVLEPAADNSIFSEGVLSNGGGVYLVTGLTVVGTERRALLAFDLSTIPAGAMVQSASLDVTVSRTISQTITVRLHRLLASWGEGTVDADGQEGTGAPAEAGDATWLQRQLGGEAWTNPGGDFAAAESARTGLRINGTYTYTGGTMAEDVQLWLDDPSQNHGWILIANPAAGFGSAKRLNSRENADGTTRPQLTVTYAGPAVAPAPPVQVPLGGGVWAMLLAGAMLLLGRPFVRR